MDESSETNIHLAATPYATDLQQSYKIATSTDIVDICDPAIKHEEHYTTENNT